ETQAWRLVASLRARSLFSGLAGHAATELRQPGNPGSDDWGNCEDRRAVRRRSLRHGHAGLIGHIRAYLGPARSAFLARGDSARARAVSELSFCSRGLLGPGMDPPATGLRLRLRQAIVRPPARGPCAARARTLTRRPGLSEQASALSRKPR